MIVGALHNEVVGMLQEIFLPGLLYQVQVPTECFPVAPLECLVPGLDLSPFGPEGALPELSWAWFHLEACCAQDLGKDATFWAWETAWVQVQEELLEQPVPQSGWSLATRRMSGIQGPAAIKPCRKPPTCL